MIDDRERSVTLTTDASGEYWEFVLTIDDYKITIAKIHLSLVQEDKPREVTLSLIKTLLEKRLGKAAEEFFKDSFTDETKH